MDDVAKRFGRESVYWRRWRGVSPAHQLLQLRSWRSLAWLLTWWTLFLADRQKAWWWGCSSKTSLELGVVSLTGTQRCLFVFLSKLFLNSLLLTWRISTEIFGLVTGFLVRTYELESQCTVSQS